MSAATEIQSDEGWWLKNLDTSRFPLEFHDLQNTNTSNFHTVIIGGGLTGVCLGYWLCHHLADPKNQKVVLLEKRTLAGGATGRNGGHLWPVNELYRAHVKDFVEFIEQENIDCDLYLEKNTPFAMGQFYPAKAVSEIAQRARTLGLLVQTTTSADTILERPDQTTDYPIQIESKDLPHPLYTQNVVYCTNGFTENLLPDFKGKIIPTRGQMIVTAPVTDFEWGGNTNEVLPGGDVYTIHRKVDSRIICGGFRLVSPTKEQPNQDDSKMNLEISQHLKKYLQDSVYKDAKKLQFEAEWTGIMGFTPDGEPYVGELRPHHYIAAGYTGNGMPRCWAAAKEVAQQICNIVPQTLHRTIPHPKFQASKTEE